MECLKIISLKREKENAHTEYLKYYLFPHKLVGQSNRSSKLDEFPFDDTSKVEEKLNKILKTKLSIGFNFVNENIDPVFYNQFNDAMKALDALSKDEKGIRYRFDRLMDRDGNSFPRHFSAVGLPYLLEEFKDNPNLVNLFSTFKNFDFRIDLSRHGMQYIYRFSLIYWDQTRWHNNEPEDKLRSELGQSIIKFIEDYKPKAKESFWTKVLKKMKSPAPLEKRYRLLSKGLFSFLDRHTGKVFSVEDYEPKYDKPVKNDDLVVHENVVEFMAYTWTRLREDMFYSMEHK